MANSKKRISELTALISASLDTTVLGVDNGTTYKIELDTLADAVTSRVNILDRDRLSFLESVTSSFETKGRSIVSGSSQLTSSYDERYVLSGSITQTTWDNIANKPNDIVSSSQQIEDLGFVTGSYAYLTEFNSLTQSFNIISGSVVNITNAVDVTQLNNTTASLNQFTSSYFTDSASFKSEITTEKNRIDAILSASNANTDTFAEVVSLINSVDLTNDNAFATFYTASNNRITSLENATSSYLTSLNGAISSSSQLTSSYDTRYVISGSITQTTWDNIASKPVGIVSSSLQVLGGSGVVSGSYETTGRGIISSSANLVTTSSFNSYTASISTASLVTSITNLNSATSSYLTSLSGAISSSSQLTSSYDTRYILSSSYNTDSSSFNSRFNGLVTTGSNTFSGSQVFSGSMTITSGQIVASSITANTSSLYLNSGSNFYVQNNGVVEITGSLKVKGTARFETVGGDEGGEIEFGVPQTNTALSTSVKADIYQNRFRIFDGNTNGVYIDLSKAPTGANGELMWKASGFVNAGDYVQLGNIKARIPTSGNRSLQVATVSGSYSVVGSDVYSAGGAAGTSITSPLSITTTPAYLNAGLHFVAVGYTDTWIIMDYVAFIAWRITMVIGPSFNANLITIERLY